MENAQEKKYGKLSFFPPQNVVLKGKKVNS